MDKELIKLKLTLYSRPNVHVSAYKHSTCEKMWNHIVRSKKKEEKLRRQCKRRRKRKRNAQKKRYGSSSWLARRKEEM
jgi:(p)ppGpp synthase/HD superfamily hydrolase